MTSRFSDELNHLDAALEAASETGAESFGVQLMRDSLLRRREELVAAGPGVLDLGLRPGTQHSQAGASIALVARVLESVQESVASIAQVLAGEPTSRGLIPNAIKDCVELRVAAATPGSLNLTLVPTTRPSETEQASLLEEHEQEEEIPLLDRSVERLIGLLADASNDQEILLQNIADIGPRATGHIQRLSKALDEGGAEASLSWRSARAQSSATLSHPAAAALAVVLEEVVEDSREVTYTGRIMGGSLVHRRFELEQADGSLIAGEVAEDALPALQALFGEACTARIQVRDARLASGETRESHLLLHLSE